MNIMLSEIIAIAQRRECAHHIEESLLDLQAAIHAAEREGNADRAERLRNVRKLLGDEHRSITGKV